MSAREPLAFYYRGLIERGSDYHWAEGYSEDINGHISYPWATRGECRRYAAKLGKIAFFVRDGVFERCFNPKMTPFRAKFFSKTFL